MSNNSFMYSCLNLCRRFLLYAFRNGLAVQLSFYNNILKNITFFVGLKGGEFLRLKIM